MKLKIYLTMKGLIQSVIITVEKPIEAAISKYYGHILVLSICYERM